MGGFPVLPSGVNSGRFGRDLLLLSNEPRPLFPIQKQGNTRRRCLPLKEHTLTLDAAAHGPGGRGRPTRRHLPARRAGRVQAFDAEAERLFHCRAEDVVGQAVWTLLPALPRTLLRVSPSAPTGQSLRLNASPKDGSSVPVELTLTRIHQGADVAWVGTLADLSRSRPEENALRRSEENHRRLFERALIGLYQTSPEGHYLRANAELARIYGYPSPESLLSQHVRARDLYVQPDRRAQFQKRLETSETVTDFESQIRRRDGTLLWISENARAVRDPDGTLLYYEGTVQDVTERKRTEEALRESEQQIRTIFDAAGVGIVRVDMAGRITRTNPAFTQMLGYAAEELEGTAFARLTHPDDSPANVQCQWDLQEGLRDGYRVEKRYCRKDGTLGLDRPDRLAGARRRRQAPVRHRGRRGRHRAAPRAGRDPRPQRAPGAPHRAHRRPAPDRPRHHGQPGH